MTRSSRLIATIVTALALAGCATDAADEAGASPEPSEPALSAPTEADSPATAPDDAATDASEAPDGGAAAAAGPATVATDDSSDHGPLLVDGDGMALYVFLEDGDGESTCFEACADNWPPLLTDGDAVADGDADERLLGTTERGDGGVQVTYDGQPLYLFAGDRAPGDLNGFGSGDVWWPVAPDGSVLDAQDGDAPAEGGY